MHQRVDPVLQLRDLRMEFDMTNLLSIVMATFDDFDGCELTLTFLRNELTGRGIADQVELLVTNNNPASHNGKRIEALCAKVGARHLPYTEKIGSAAPRDAAIRAATGKWVVCCDCHIQLLFGVLPQLLEFCRTTDSTDLFHGPLCSEQMIQPDGKPALVWTHWAPIWGNNGMLGKQSGLPPEKLAEGKPIEIVGAGLGLFLTMKEHWLGFPPELREFGSEELCIHHAYRQAGRKAWLLPWLHWWHKFRDETSAPPYPTHHAATCWNYLVWHTHTGFPALSGIRAAFVDRDRLKDRPGLTTHRSSAEVWQMLLQELRIDEAAAYAQEIDRQIPTLPIELADNRIVMPPVPQSAPPKPPEGPGTELETINRECFGIEPNDACNCKGKIKQMDAWGVAGCRKNYWTIVGWMKDGEKDFGWTDKISAMAGALTSGIAFRIKWSEPWPGIITEAINRAEAKERTKGGQAA